MPVSAAPAEPEVPDAPPLPNKCLVLAFQVPEYNVPEPVAVALESPKVAVPLAPAVPVGETVAVFTRKLELIHADWHAA